MIVARWIYALTESERAAVEGTCRSRGCDEQPTHEAHARITSAGRTHTRRHVICTLHAEKTATRYGLVIQ